MLGGASHLTLEKVLAIKKVASDDTYSPELRRRASEASQKIEEGSAVDPLFLDLRTAVQIEELERIASDQEEPSEVRDAARSGAILMAKLDAEGKLSPQEMERAARAALERVVTAKRGKKTPSSKQSKPAKPPAPKKKSVKHFLWLWNEMATWPQDYDPAIIAAEVSDEKWLEFKHTMSAGIEFMEAVDELRAARLFAA
jgi:uncharacterized protein (UPF0147 family)